MSGSGLCRLAAAVISAGACTVPPAATPARPLATSAMTQAEGHTDPKCGSPGRLCDSYWDTIYAGVSGVVRDPNGIALDGALVAVVPNSEESAEAASMSSSGGGRFYFVDLKPGLYAITATAPHFVAAYAGGLTLRPGKPTEVNVKLGRDGVTIRGTVLDVAKRPASGFLVRLARFSDRHDDLFLVRTDMKGAYEVMLPKARYDVRAQMDGMAFQMLTAGAADETIDINLGSKPSGTW